VYRDITVIEYAAILVGMLGYRIEKWPTDVTKYATMAGLFTNVKFDDLADPVSYQQAAQITVNAMQAAGVQNLREIYVNQGVDVYEEITNPLLAAGGQAGLTGKVKYAYTYNHLTTEDTVNDISALAHDAFAYPGTALISTSDATKGLIKGFVPHFTNLYSYTVGLGTAPTGANVPTSLIPGGVYTGDVWLNGTQTATPITGILSKEPGTYIDVVSYESATETKYRAVEIKHTLIDTSYNFYVGTPVYWAPSVEKAEKEVPYGSFALVVEATAAPGYYTTQTILSYEAVAPQSAKVNSWSKSKSDKFDFTVASFTTSSDAKTRVSGDATVSDAQLNFVENGVSVIFDTRDVFYYVAGTKVAGWTASSAKYLYYPETSIGNNEVYNAGKALTEKHYNVILDTGALTPNVAFAPAGTALNGNGLPNVAPVADNFYEYTVLANGTYAVFALSNGAGGVGSAIEIDYSTAEAAAFATTTSYAGAFATENPVAATAANDYSKPRAYKYAEYMGTVYAAGLLGLTTTYVQVGVKASATANTSDTFNYTTKAGTGYNTITYDDGNFNTALRVLAISGSAANSTAIERVVLVYILDKDQTGKAVIPPTAQTKFHLDGIVHVAKVEATADGYNFYKPSESATDLTPVLFLTLDLDKGSTLKDKVLAAVAGVNAGYVPADAYNNPAYWIYPQYSNLPVVAYTATKGYVLGGSLATTFGTDAGDAVFSVTADPTNGYPLGSIFLNNHQITSGNPYAPGLQIGSRYDKLTGFDTDVYIAQDIITALGITA
jgi:hypothetical protein